MQCIIGLLSVMTFKDPETAKEIVYEYHGVIFTFLL